MTAAHPSNYSYVNRRVTLKDDYTAAGKGRAESQVGYNGEPREVVFSKTPLGSTDAGG